MIKLLSSFIPAPYRLVAGIVAAAVLAIVLLATGFNLGARLEASRWQADKIRYQAEAADALAAALAAQASAHAKREQTLQEGANAIAELKVIQLPGRVEIQKRVIKVPVYRDADCHAEQRVLDIVNAARAGSPVTEESLRALGDGVPADAAARL